MRIYSCWKNMRKRCLKPHDKDYPRYGGRGITICGEWVENYWNFQEWALSSGYDSNLTIERKDNDKGYSPSNCHWVNMAAQARNKSNVTLNFAKAEEIRELDKLGVSTKTIAEKYNISPKTVRSIVKYLYWWKDDNGNQVYERGRREKKVLKLNIEKAAEIRKIWHETDKPQTVIAEEYGVAPSTVTNIIKNLKWRDENYQENLSEEIKKAKRDFINTQATGKKLPPKEFKKKKLTFALAEEIRRKHEQGAAQKHLAEEYGVATKQISRVIKNLVWDPEDYAKV